MAPPTIAEWIRSRERPVPEPLRRRLAADGPASAEALVEAAEREARTCAAGSRRDHEAAFGLLAADAYVTYACLRVVLTEGPGDALRRITTRVAEAPWRE